MRQIVALVFAGFLLAPRPAPAQVPATIRGQVYDCNQGDAIAGAAVELRGLDDGSTIVLRAARDGRFARVGLLPGRYLISATDPGPKQDPLVHLRDVTTTASRMARVEMGDVLDVRIGTYRTLRLIMPPRVSSTNLPLAPNEPHPACDPAFVPASPTINRYVVH